MKYRWRDLAFDIDDGLQDQTMVVLSRAGQGAEPAYTVCVADDQAPDGLQAYVDVALREMSTSLPGFRIGSRHNATVMGARAVVVEARTLSPEGISLVQKQAFVERTKDAVLVVTGSAPEEPKLAALMVSAIDRLIASLARDTP